MNLYYKVYDNLYIIPTGPAPCEDYITSYLIVSASRKAVVIDPGPQSSVERVYRALRDLGLERSLELIIPTHVHLDHAGASARLAKLTGAAVVVHPRGAPHIRDPSRLWRASREVQGDIVDLYGMPDEGLNIEIIEARDLVDMLIDDIDLKILYTPGHASHHISVVWGSRSVLFSGDSAGIYIPEIDSVLPTTPPPFRYEQYMESLEKMIRERPRIVAYTHRGVREDSGVLESHMQQMRTWFETLVSLEDLSRGSEEILRALAERDPYTKRYMSYRDVRGDCRVNIANLEMTLRGFIEEVNRIKSLK